jgi:hypothetical protein
MIRIKTELYSFCNNIYSLYLHTEVHIVSKLCILIILINVRSGDGIPVGVRLSAPVQFGLGAHLPSCIMNISLLPREKHKRRGIDHRPHLAPRVQIHHYASSGPLWKVIGKL